jgi:hypothetical protein
VVQTTTNSGFIGGIEGGDRYQFGKRVIGWEADPPSVRFLRRQLLRGRYLQAISPTFVFQTARAIPDLVCSSALTWQTIAVLDCGMHSSDPTE